MPNARPPEDRAPVADQRRSIGRASIPVLLVLLLLAGVVVGLLVGRYGPWPRNGTAHKQTMAVGRVVMRAVGRFAESTGGYPGEDSDDCVTLMKALHEHNASREILRDLAEDYWQGPGKPLRDGYGEPMRYRATGGPSGKPVLISKGPDRQLGTPDDIRCDAE